MPYESFPINVLHITHEEKKTFNLFSPLLYFFQLDPQTDPLLLILPSSQPAYFKMEPLKFKFSALKVYQKFYPSFTKQFNHFALITFQFSSQLPILFSRRFQ